jgi:hypothetical protein
VQTVNLSLYLGHENATNYTWNESYYLQPISPNESDGTYFAAGFGANTPSSIAMKVASPAGINDLNTVEGMAYPNPSTDVVTISIEGEGVASLTVTDVAGRIAMSNNVTLTAGKAALNIANLEAGVYIFNVVLENGKTAQFNVVKK